MTAEGR